MAMFGLGVFYGGVIVGVPVVTGVAEGVQHQQEQNKEAANEERMVKFHIDVFCSEESSKAKEVHNTMVVLRNDKVRWSLAMLLCNGADVVKRRSGSRRWAKMNSHFPLQAVVHLLILSRDSTSSIPTTIELRLNGAS